MDWNDFAKRLTLELARLPVGSFLIVQGAGGLPYAQAMRSEGAVDAEAVGSAFLPRPLAARQERRLAALGWERPDERQNWWCRFTMRDRSRVTAEEMEECGMLAGRMVGAFRDVYGIRSPLELVYQASRTGADGGPLTLPGLGIPLALPEDDPDSPSSADLESVLASARERGDQETYLDLVSRAMLFLPAPGDPTAADHAYATAQFGDGTFVLAFTSLDAMNRSLRGQAVHHRSAFVSELAAHWPNPEWQLAINPGLASAAYLDATVLQGSAKQEPVKKDPTIPPTPDDVHVAGSSVARNGTRRASTQPSAARPNVAGAAPAAPVTPSPPAPTAAGPAANVTVPDIRVPTAQPSANAPVTHARPPNGAGTAPPAPYPAAQVPSAEGHPLTRPQGTGSTSARGTAAQGGAAGTGIGAGGQAGPSAPAPPGAHGPAAYAPHDGREPNAATLPGRAAQEAARARSPQNGDSQGVRMGADVRAGVVVMQKVLRPEHVPHYLDGGYDLVAGYVHRFQDVRELNTPARLIRGLGLVYEGSPFSTEAESVHVVRWPAMKPALFRRPLGGIDEWSMGIIPGGWVIEKAPFPGSGYAPGDGPPVPEFKIDSQRLPHGAEMYRLDRTGAATLVATYDSDLRRWAGGRG